MSARHQPLPEEADDTVGQLLVFVVDALGELAELHIALARAELARDFKSFLRDAAPLLVAVPVLGAGYLLSCVAFALALAPLLGGAGGFLAVGIGNLIAGGIAARYSLSRLRSRQLVIATVGLEAERSAVSMVRALRVPGPGEVCPAP